MAEHTSAGAALALRKLGVRNVRALLGGFREWTLTGKRLAYGREPGR